MGGMQAYHWAALCPDTVERLAVLCGAAKKSQHNLVFLEGVRATLTADANHQDGGFVALPERGLRVMGRVYAGWAMSQTVYRDELWRQTGRSFRMTSSPSGKRTTCVAILAICWR